MKYYTIYATTNIITGHVYIGKHETHNLDDGYLGSGLRLKRAIAKYGVQSFRKEILYIFKTPEEMHRKEIEIVTEDFCLREDIYNIALGGQGGKIVLYPEHPMYDAIRQKISATKYRKSEDISRRTKELHAQKRVGMYGKTQSQKQRDTVSAMLKGKPKSEEHKRRANEARRKTYDDPNYTHPNKGRERPDAKERFKQIPNRTCIHCGLTTNAGNHARHHGDRCKRKQTNENL